MKEESLDIAFRLAKEAYLASCHAQYGNALTEIVKKAFESEATDVSHNLRAVVVAMLRGLEERGLIKEMAGS